MIAIAPQIENAHTVKAVVVGRVVRDITLDKCEETSVRINAFTFQIPNRILQGSRTGVAKCSNGVVVSEKCAMRKVR